ncbi:MAG: hypothetical protein HQL96_12605 [Magnetococcales bacterium]|nr:hypothetical protein [Magnetococcales bacterium]
MTDGMDTPRSQAWKNLLPLLLVCVSLGAMFGPTWVTYLERAADPFRFSDDVRSYLLPAWRFVDPELFPGAADVDYIQWLSPLGYQGIYALGAHWLDPVTFGKLLGGVMFLAGMAVIGLAAGLMSGWAGAWFAMALMLSSWGPELSGMPRNLSIPLLALAVVALLRGRVYLLAAMVLIAALFYPPVAVMISGMLFLWLMVWPARDRGEAREWSFKKRVLLLVVTALLTFLLEGKQWFGARNYGPILTAAYCDAYPEIGPEGRLGNVNVCQPSDTFLSILTDTTQWTLTDGRRGEPWLYAPRVLGKWTLAKAGIDRDALLVNLLLLLLLAGYLAHLARDTLGRRLLILPMVGVLGFLAAQPFAPQFYYPLRYLEKTIPIFLMVGLPAAVSALASLPARWRAGPAWGHPWVRPGGVLIVACVVLLVLGGRGKSKGGIDKDHRFAAPLMHHLHSLPKDVVIAGWPRGIVASVPLLAQRSVFVNEETHWPLHKHFTDTMRTRALALIEGYLATTPGPLIALRERFGVTHMIVDRNLFAKGSFGLFAPFQAFADKKKKEAEGQGYEILRQIPHAQTFALANLVVLDMRRLQP